jgi:ADP-ribosylglycohydrolase
MILGAITGDVIGSRYEFFNTKKKDFQLFSEYSQFTDDTVLTVATMECLLSKEKDYTLFYQMYSRDFPSSGFGSMFCNWMYEENPQPYYSFGNGSGMRVSPVGWFFKTLEETLAEAERSAAVTHNHPEGIKGAQAIASAVFLARTGKSKEEIKQYIATTFNYDLNRTCDEIRPDYCFDVTCQGSVPESIIAFLESKDFESAIRLAVSLGGDSDTIAAMTGAIAEAFYGSVPEWIADEIIKRLPEVFIEVIKQFTNIIATE